MFVSIIDLGFVGAFIGAVYVLRFIGDADCTKSSSASWAVSFAGVGVSGPGVSVKTDKTCAMLKASWAFGIMNCIFFAITAILALMVGRGSERKTVVRETHYSRHGSRRSGSHRSHHSSHSGRRRAYV